MRAVLGIQLLLAAAFGVLEASGRFHIPYSKFRSLRGFRWTASVNSRVGWFVAYLVPLLVYVGLHLQAGSPRSPYHWALLAGMVFHFGKRCLESLFLHKYSKPTGATAYLLIIWAYSTMVLAAGWFQTHAVSAAEGWAPELRPALIAGAGIFLVGQAINFYHHLLLARLRPAGAVGQGYRVPQGGLFRWVACPHYLGEIISWVGYAVMAGLPPSWGNAAVVVVYLGARSRSTLRWYQQNLPDWPADRRALVPRLF
jgi:3-oxo-5-alpha-steroid 4-dehydrogenase 1